MKTNGYDAEAIHVANGEKHIVGFKSLKVLLSKDDGIWFAQGLEIDYASAGATIEEVKSNFETGLKKTVAEHIRLNGTIDKLLKSAPQEAFNDYYDAKSSDLKQMFSTIQFHDLCVGNVIQHAASECFPFDKIEFLEPLAA